MDSTPHTHNLNISTQAHSWYISYGDQSELVEMPYFRKPKNVLAGAVRKIISKHDKESLKAGQKQLLRKQDEEIGNTAIAAVRQTVVLSDPKNWGSKQLH